MNLIMYIHSVIKLMAFVEIKHHILTLFSIIDICALKKKKRETYNLYEASHPLQNLLDYGDLGLTEE